MITFKVNGEERSIPSTWDDVKYGQHLSLVSVKDDFNALLSVLSGLDYETIKKAKITGLEGVISALSFVKKAPELPQVVAQVGKYKLPINKDGRFSIEFETLAQFEDMRHVMKSADSVEKLGHAYGEFVSIYLQAIRDGEYDPMKVDSMRAEVLEMPAKEVICAGAFFYVKLISLLNGTPITYPHTVQSPKKSKRVSKGSGKSSGRRSR